jgi:hypothetical protein
MEILFLVMGAPLRVRLSLHLHAVEVLKIPRTHAVFASQGTTVWVERPNLALPVGTVCRSRGIVRSVESIRISRLVRSHHAYHVIPIHFQTLGQSNA